MFFIGRSPRFVSRTRPIRNPVFWYWCWPVGALVPAMARLQAGSSVNEALAELILWGVARFKLLCESEMLSICSSIHPGNHRWPGVASTSSRAEGCFLWSILSWLKVDLYKICCITVACRLAGGQWESILETWMERQRRQQTLLTRTLQPELLGTRIWYAYPLRAGASRHTTTGPSIPGDFFWHRLFDGSSDEPHCRGQAWASRSAAECWAAQSRVRPHNSRDSDHVKSQLQAWEWEHVSHRHHIHRVDLAAFPTNGPGLRDQHKGSPRHLRKECQERGHMKRARTRQPNISRVELMLLKWELVLKRLLRRHPREVVALLVLLVNHTWNDVP